MGFFTIYIRQCTENSAMVTSGPSTANGLSLQSPHGLDPAVIESFPIFVYWEIKDIKIGEGALECAVCLSEFEGDENLRLLPKCDHVFHPECIDTWFASNTTCPVCRADLTLISGESAGVIEQRVESNDLADEQIPGSEVGELQDQVSINVENALCSDSKLVEIMNQSRRIAEKFPRSHSTGHSLVQPGENCERYKLTLPDEVRKQMMTQRLKRTTSCIVVLRREGSSKRGYTSGGEGSSRGKRMGESDRVGSSDRWVFKMTPPFFTRTGSVRSLKVCADKSVLVVGSSKVDQTMRSDVMSGAGSMSVSPYALPGQPLNPAIRPYTPVPNGFPNHATTSSRDHSSTRG
ncbi:hypothetical protein F0562_003183 [Nyssa sinensis]|uniref:RING-type E3 ubiquitin transferase n=1 Tax=Nyssa sinensis TaxID=561372 RepID=A0A5J5BVT6_9ASTE|nr:hypothetical protein F0562_003183 [Nyssa sinensis]